MALASWHRDSWRLVFIVCAACVSGLGMAAAWVDGVRLPASERVERLFNGKDFSGWEGQIEKYWSVQGGAIRGANREAVPASTYLFTKRSYREFRVLLEVKQTRGPDFSTMHSAK